MATASKRSVVVAVVVVVNIKIVVRFAKLNSIVSLNQLPGWTGKNSS